MTAHPGKDVLLQLGDGAAPETFATVGGLRATSLSLGAAAVDVTTMQSEGRWRELLGGAGVRQASVAGAGVFLDDASAASVRALFFNGEVRRWRLVLPGLGAVEGPFLVVNLDYAGDHDGEATMALQLASAGAVGFVPAA